MHKDTLSLECLLKNIETDLSTINLSFDKQEYLDKISQYENQINSVDFWDNKEAAEILKSCNHLKNLIHKVDEFNNTFKDLCVMKDIAVKEEDNNFYEACLTEANALYRLVSIEKIKNLFNSEEDRGNCYLEIHSGSGGVDAQDFASILLRLYTRWAERNKFKLEIIDESKVDIGIKSIVLKISGDYVYGYLRSENGIHRLVRISPYNSEGKRHTSFVAVSTYPEVDKKINIIIDPSSLRIDTYKSAGAGGQHVNTTDSAVRITHIPTGIVVQCQTERSQHKNKETAMSLLRAKIYQQELDKQKQDKQDSYNTKQGIDFGSQIRSYVFHPYSLVKDHRTGIENFNVKDVLDGEIDEFIFAFLTKNIVKIR